MAERHTTGLSLTLFAGFRLHDPSGDSVRLPTKKARALLAFLAVQPGLPHSREKLMALLWGERSDKQARHSLNQTLVHIRKAVSETDDRILDSDRESVTFVSGSLAVDAVKFRELVAEHPTEAMDLYKGPFLDGIGIKEVAFEEWLSGQRSELHNLACKALELQRERFTDEGRHTEAIEMARRLVMLDPSREEAHRQLMRLYYEAGDRISALKQYQTCVVILERELDIRPASETTRLFKEIKSIGKGPGLEKGAEDRNRDLEIDVAPASGTDHKPSIAVLPFVNMSGDPEQEYLADGVSEDIITELSRYPDFLVIARNSTFVYKRQAVAHKQIARDLGVQFVLEGSVRRRGDRVRIAAQLIDTQTSQHLWAERFDRTLDDIFTVQDEIASTIVGTLGDAIQVDRLRRATRKDPSNLDAYDKTLQAWTQFSRFNKVGNAEARRLAEAAIALDADYARAQAILAWTHVMDFSSRWTDDPDESLRQAIAAARKAVSLDDHNAYANLVAGACETWLGRHDQAREDYRRAIELNPNDADTHAHFANHLVFAGHSDEALEELKTAMRLNPHYPASYLQFMGRAYFTQRRYEEAESAFERVVTVNPGWPWAHLTLAATRAALGKFKEARAGVADAQGVSPGLTLAYAPKAWPFKDAADLDHLMGLLRKAGLPD